ncbi:hypothetical protein M408DRAFT_108152 [Serendipita vermifera MAFF 305830]|uniref:Uncharacterized protein n=1 Tax=Serendipita vermifera MAFF 305830 TaxID=933852 RepID=A0A0C3AZ97_SERVB|nr:hypothetical protein M408DRAFT_108152 [Serendipita vermifera MAFF 305830]
MTAAGSLGFFFPPSTPTLSRVSVFFDHFDERLPRGLTILPDMQTMSHEVEQKQCVHDSRHISPMFVLAETWHLYWPAPDGTDEFSTAFFF